jgi:hypothetical protein
VEAIHSFGESRQRRCGNRVVVHIRIELPEQYFRQYIGVSHRKQRRIYINAFCDNQPPSDWRDHLYTDIDGATCYWQAVYDPVTKTFSNLTINARA